MKPVSVRTAATLVFVENKDIMRPKSVRDQFFELEKEVEQYKDEITREMEQLHPLDYLYSVWRRGNEHPQLLEHPVIEYWVDFQPHNDFRSVEQPVVTGRMHRNYLSQLKEYYTQIQENEPVLKIKVEDLSLKKGFGVHILGKPRLPHIPLDYGYYETIEEADDAYSQALEEYEQTEYEENNYKQCYYCKKNFAPETMFKAEILTRGRDRMSRKEHDFCSEECLFAAQRSIG